MRTWCQRRLANLSGDQDGWSARVDRDRPGQPPRRAAIGRRRDGCAPLPAAIGNAVFDATGVRLRRVPFTPERVKASLSRGPERVRVRFRWI
jgi:hypothetical protein